MGMMNTVYLYDIESFFFSFPFPINVLLENPLTILASSKRNFTDDSIQNVSVSNSAISPGTTVSYPLLALSLWEHSYLPTHGLDRSSYVKAFFPFINWKRVDKLLDAAVKTATSKL